MAEFKRVDLKKNKPQEVEVASLKRPVRRLSSKTGKEFPRFAPLFGILVAVGWHYLHQAGETYRPTPDDPQFWFHLAVEGTIALYAAFFYLVVWKVWQRLK